MRRLTRACGVPQYIVSKDTTDQGSVAGCSIDPIPPTNGCSWLLHFDQPLFLLQQPLGSRRSCWSRSRELSSNEPHHTLGQCF